MAKMTIEFQSEKIKKKLEFQGNEFEYTMLPTLYGMKADKPSIEDQFIEKYPNDVYDEELMDHVSNLDFGDEDDIKFAIDYLSSIE